MNGLILIWINLHRRHGKLTHFLLLLLFFRKFYIVGSERVLVRGLVWRERKEKKRKQKKTRGGGTLSVSQHAIRSAWWTKSQIFDNARKISSITVAVFSLIQSNFCRCSPIDFWLCRTLKLTTLNLLIFAVDSLCTSTAKQMKNLSPRKW